MIEPKKERLLPKPIFNEDIPLDIPNARFEVKTGGAYKKENFKMVLKVIRFKLDKLEADWSSDVSKVRDIIGSELFPMNIGFKCELIPCNNQYVTPSVAETIIHIMTKHYKDKYSAITTVRNGLYMMENNFRE